MPESGFRSALSSASEVTIAFIGRKSGKKFSTPIWFVEKDGKLRLLPVDGKRSAWYRNVAKNPMVEVDVSGKSATAKARAITDASEVAETMEMFRKKYGAGEVRRWYPGQDAAVELSILS